MTSVTGSADTLQRRVSLGLRSLRAVARDVAPAHHLESLYAYGSVARGDNRPDSDVDLIYSFSPGQPASASAIISLKNDLEQRLHSTVSLVSRNAVLWNARHSTSGALFYRSIEPDMTRLV